MDHEDLIQELPNIERLSNQERLKLAHRRRLAQLKKYGQYEKDLMSKKNKAHHEHNKKANKHKNTTRIRFRNSVMLLEAAGRNDMDEVRVLLEAGVDPDAANEDGLTALHQCCIDDNEEMMRLLVSEFRANVNSEDSEFWTPLHAASTCGHLHLVKYLIAKGANLLAVNAEGNMAYDICDDEATLDHIESEMAKRGVTQELIEETRALPETRMLQDMQLLHSQGGDLELRDKDGATPLHIAAANGYTRVVEFLLDNHASTEVVDKDNWAAIHAAACWGHMDVLELLVQNGADLNARTKNNETPYAICEDPEIKERIIQLRSEQETKAQDAARRKIRRSQSSNSRTQSIRRTSHRRDISKKDAAEEAQQLLMAREINTKEENSPSPTMEMLATPQTITGTNGIYTEHSSEEDGDEERNKSLPPSIFYGKDSVSQIKVAPNEMDRLREIASQNILTNGGNIHKGSNINHNNNKLQGKYLNNPVLVPAILDSNENLPPHELAIPTPVETNANVQVKGSKGLPLPSLHRSSDSIDIHVSVTINTTSSSPTSPEFDRMNSGMMTPSPCPSMAMILSNNSYTSPGTLADLKKQRSLQYLNRSHAMSLNGLTDIPTKYSMPPSPSMSLRRFAGDSSGMVGDYSDAGKKCCIIM